MTAPEIIDRLRSLGVRVRAQGQALLVEAECQPPDEAQRLVEELRGRKGEALASLLAWNQPRAGEMLVSAQTRLQALLDGRPIPEPDLICQAAYERLAAAHDAHNWPEFEAAVADFETTWRERIARN